ncbi:sensor histidine kinase [Peloplasma aerotolerans]|uniref:histidine kinase n=1 Tax=Peloplasma aerotolerans TaxID=3044389 RepID=A0AAW6UD87_9MOLU|nr:histidine kinase [Mariniplasma sp. M4Ah]MDI6453609.1 histidine kinase [Mariniplasma sp. M4Ah]MDR4968386.1 histidine kinase [Acholeplasmataceae bacterium]
MRSYVRPDTILYALVTILYGLVFWLIKPQEPAVFFLMIVSVLLMVLRMRFHLQTHYLLIELALYIAVSFYFIEALYLLIPSISIWIYREKFYLIGVYVLVWIGLLDFRYDYVVLALFSVFSSIILSFWSKDHMSVTKEIDQLREEKYTLEQERYHLLQTQEEISKLSVISERDRIAQKLHDDLGHELTGALLAIRAYETQIIDASKNESFKALKNRIEKAVESLKETVHHTKPEEVYNLEHFKGKVHELAQYEISFVQKGIVNSLKVTHWHAFLSVLKEAYTNIQKHSKATEINVVLHVDEKIAKLSITNNHSIMKKNKEGVGLHFMRRRIEALGGTLIVNPSYLFTLTCVIPIYLEE